MAPYSVKNFKNSREEHSKMSLKQRNESRTIPSSHINHCFMGVVLLAIAAFNGCTRTEFPPIVIIISGSKFSISESLSTLIAVYMLTAFLL